jgi:hypothetical protein
MLMNAKIAAKTFAEMMPFGETIVRQRNSSFDEGTGDMTTLERTAPVTEIADHIAVAIVDTDVHPHAGVRRRAEVPCANGVGRQALADRQSRHPHPALL